MPDILIRIKKKTDGSAALSCIRSDGTVAWQQQNGQQGRFFPLHDLTHYAVETALDLRGFFSLVAEGWDFGDFGKPWPRGPLPAEAHVVEQVVGFLDTERASGREWAAADLHVVAPYVCSPRRICVGYATCGTSCSRAGRRSRRGTLSSCASHPCRGTSRDM
jgi:hypothetical protein